MRKKDLRRKRRSSGGSVLKVLIIVVIGASIIWAGWSLRKKTVVKEASTLKLEKTVKKKEPPPSVVDQRTFLVLGVEGDEETGKQKVTDVLALVYDPARNGINGMVIDPETYVSIPGRGYQPISEGFDEGPKHLLSAISEMIRFELEGYFMVSRIQFDALVQDRKLDTPMSEAQDTSFKKKEVDSLSAKVENIPSERVKFLNLPVKTIVIGEQTYYEPKKDDLDNTLLAVLGRIPKKEKAPTRIIILNGAGTPGIARVAADRLVGKGFKILDIKNADNFDYTKTEILLYNKQAKKSGKTVAKALRSGVLINKNMAQDVTDIVIVIGEDFE